MGLSIEEIMRRAGIKETAGSFDAVTPQPEQQQPLTTPQQPSEGVGGTRISPAPVSSKRVDPVFEALVDRLRRDESPRDDIDTGDFTFYEEDSLKGKGTVRNIGPGLNLETSRIRQLIDKHTKDVPNLSYKSILENKGISGIKDFRPVMEKVFRDAVKLAKNDAIKYIGGKKLWDQLSDHEQSALANMSYNMGLPTLSGFTNMRKALQALTNFRKKKIKNDDLEGKLIDAVTDEMTNSLWYGQVRSRGPRVVSQFIGKKSDAVKQKSDAVKRWKALSTSSKQISEIIPKTAPPEMLGTFG